MVTKVAGLHVQQALTVELDAHALLDCAVYQQLVCTLTKLNVGIRDSRKGCLEGR